MSEVIAETKEGGKSKGKKWIIILILSGILGILLLVYLGTAFYFQSHFFPNVWINGADISYLTAGEASDILEKQIESYVIDVEDYEGGKIGTLTASDVGVFVDVKDEVNALLGQQDIFCWIMAFFDTYGHAITYEIQFDTDILPEAIGDWEAFQRKNMETPKDAYISDYLPEMKQYEIIAETHGSKLDMDRVREVLTDAIHAGRTTVNLEEEDCYVKASVTDEDAGLNKRLDIMNKWVSTAVTYDWNGREVILDGDIIYEWISEEKGEPVLDEEAVAEFVAAWAKEYDTYGRKRSFVTTQGAELVLPSAYGWKTDRNTETEELIQLIHNGAVTEREPVYSITAAQKGVDDIGKSYVEIDLSNQHLYLYASGKIVLESDFVSGRMNRSGSVTPGGIYGLTYKTRNAVLRGDDYETPVSYWMPFNGNIGMHDATWRNSFGGDIYLTNGSHGCINLPYDAAKSIYSYVEEGFPIICYY